MWALQRTFVEAHCRNWNPGAITVTAPTPSNPNLHAQAGLFTLVRFLKRAEPQQVEVDFPVVDELDARQEQERTEVDIPLLDELLLQPAVVATARGTRGVLPLPMLYKFTLPCGEAGALLHYLDRCGVNAATLFPGHKSVVEYMREAKYRNRRTPWST